MICDWCNLLVREEERSEEGDGSGGDWGECGADPVDVSVPVSEGSVAWSEAGLDIVANSEASSEGSGDCGLASSSRSRSLESETSLARCADLGFSVEVGGVAVGSGDGGGAGVLLQDLSDDASLALSSGVSFQLGVSSAISDLGGVGNAGVWSITISNQGEVSGANGAGAGGSSLEAVGGGSGLAFFGVGGSSDKGGNEVLSA